MTGNKQKNIFEVVVYEHVLGAVPHKLPQRLVNYNRQYANYG